jgi:hypothetical protein
VEKNFKARVVNEARFRAVEALRPGREPLEHYLKRRFLKAVRLIEEVI